MRALSIYSDRIAITLLNSITLVDNYSVDAVKCYTSLLSIGEKYIMFVYLFRHSILTGQLF